jgi:hypothetical protein
LNEKVRIPIPKTLPAQFAHAESRDHHTDLARRYVELTGGGAKQVEVMLAAIVSASFTAKSSTSTGTTRNEVEAALGAALDVHRKEIEDASIAETRARFTSGDLQFLLGFYASPDGQRVLELLARPIQNNAQFGQIMDRLLVLAQRLVRGAGGVES